MTNSPQSDRDVSGQVPINFVPHPGVSVTAACFGDNIYNNSGAENCLSNLMFSQIRRYVIDVYWDTASSQFNLCPLQIPAQLNNNSQIATSEGSISVDNTVQAASLTARQVRTSYSINATSTQPSTATTSVPPSYSVISSDGSSQLIQLGPYQCSNTLTLASVTSVFADYLARTSNTLDARVLIWIINLHVAAPWDRPTEPDNLTANQLPRSNETISSYLDNLDDVLYKPGRLLSDRRNLNTSWFRRETANSFPLLNYYNLIHLDNGDIATDDGWPNEDFVQVALGKRMLVGFGTIDDDISIYNTSADGDRVYPPNYITAAQSVTYEDSGELSSGCFYNPNEFTVDQVNNSWAVATIDQVSPPNLGNAADNLTTCGMTQLLNVTLEGITADVQAGPYQDFGNNAVFGWAYGQPQNDSSVSTNVGKFRCALMVSSDAYRGHWRVEYCNAGYRAACREANSPYLWRISSYTVPYGSGDAACTGNTTFDVPRTGLEQRYLYNKILADSVNDSGLLNGVWINFNSLDYQNCWVTTGVNGSCPYFSNQSATHSRHILIPTIAALIVLILTVLTIFAKFSANARNSRIRRRGEGGWDYEGIPS